MINATKYANPFHGNLEVDLPKREGIAATWFFLKAQTGNTHPGACTPFGMVSACAYSGAYPTGYGLNNLNCHSKPPKMYDTLCASGFTHFQQSGTGKINNYYNYIRVTPLNGSLSQLGKLWNLKNEEAVPGYYAAELEGTGIRAELTVSGKAAFHSYTFANNEEARIIIDFSNRELGAKFTHRKDKYPIEAKLEAISPNAVQGYVWMDAPVYTYIQCDNKIDSCKIWLDKAETGGITEFSTDNPQNRSFGFVFNLDKNASPVTNVRFGFSFRSMEQAKRNLMEQEGKSFDCIRKEAESIWNAYLNKIEIETDDEQKKEIFYSCLYHSLTKPMIMEGESPLWTLKKEYCVDIATLWDQYKTQLPLIMTLYQENGRDIVNFLLNTYEFYGFFTNYNLMSTQYLSYHSTDQCRAIACYVITDAFNRSVEGINWNRALDCMVNDFRRPVNNDYRDKGFTPERYTHTLDLAGACFCISWMADKLGHEDLSKEFMELSKKWINVFDLDTGLLNDKAEYYEGTNWNYSFRLQHDMERRIGLFKKEEDFITALDRFFGYGREPVKQPENPDDSDYVLRGHKLYSFEGFNNEPDMEAPYSYIYAGRHDRTAEVVRTGMKYMFTTGRGGLPGNDDSGGLSSCYVCNSIGLFPVSGQPLFLIGSPIFKSVKLKLKNVEFTVRTVNNSDENIYVQMVELNGGQLNRAYLFTEEVINGGELILYMGNTPTGWARDNRPPSYR
jgi:predicted alpha-1,2-mannosidase